MSSKNERKKITTKNQTENNNNKLHINARLGLEPRPLVSKSLDYRIHVFIPFSQNSMYNCIFHGFPCRMIWKMHGCTRKSMDIRVKVSVYDNVHGKSKHSTRKSMELFGLRQKLIWKYVERVNSVKQRNGKHTFSEFRLFSIWKSMENSTWKLHNTTICLI